MKLSDVSKTAIITLRCHVLESKKSKPILNDPMAELCLDGLISLATEDEKALLFDRKLLPALTNHIAIRARKYDAITNNFIARNSASTVINLGCGFDTRYWRIDNTKCLYIELDLPEVVALKKELLKDHLVYEMMGCSVLDTAWIDKVTLQGNRNFLLIAEGLFMYLPKNEVITLFNYLTEKFSRSQIVMEVVTDKYTSGIWKKIVTMKMRHETGFIAGSSFNFGIKDAFELESYGSGLKIIDEWSYFEDKDVRPQLYKMFKYSGLARAQWTITASINAEN